MARTTDPATIAAGLTTKARRAFIRGGWQNVTHAKELIEAGLLNGRRLAAHDNFRFIPLGNYNRTPLGRAVAAELERTDA